MFDHKWDVYDALISSFLIIAFLIGVWENPTPYYITTLGTIICACFLVWIIIRLVGDMIDG